MVTRGLDVIATAVSAGVFTGATLVGQATNALESVSPLNIILQLGAFGVLCLLVVNVFHRTIPNLVKDFKEESAESRASFEKTLAAQRADFREELAAERTLVESLTNLIDRIMLERNK